MTAPLPALAGRLPLGRRSTLLFDYRAADLSLLARSGQQLAIVRTTQDVVTTDYGLALIGYDAPRFQRVDTTGDGIVDSMGLLIEPAVTQLALWASDFTNAAWVKTGLTAAKTQTGVDGVVNAASLLTATAANGTALQAITSANNQRVTSAWVRRVTGTGTVNMTQDNGTTWTAIVLTSAWKRFSVQNLTATANPTIGLRLVTSGDAIAVDYVQHEIGAYPTSAWRSTSASVDRNADTVTGTAAWPTQNNLTVYLKVTPEWFALSGGLLFGDAYGLMLSSLTPYLAIRRASASGVWTAVINTSGTSASQSAVAPVTALQEVCVQFAGMLAGGTVAIDVGSGMSTVSAAATGFAALGSTNLYLGAFSSPGNELGGSLLVAKVATGLLTMTQMRGAR